MTETKLQKILKINGILCVIAAVLTAVDLIFLYCGRAVLFGIADIFQNCNPRYMLLPDFWISLQLVIFWLVSMVLTSRICFGEQYVGMYVGVFVCLVLFWLVYFNEYFQNSWIVHMGGVYLAWRFVVAVLTIGLPVCHLCLHLHLKKLKSQTSSAT